MSTLPSFHVERLRFFVLIGISNAPGGYTTVMTWDDLPFATFTRFRWYFDYRAALLKVENPRKYVELRTWRQEIEPPIEVEIRVLRNKIINKKGKITEYRNRIAKAEKTWASLFPIADDPGWKYATAKVERSILELAAMEEDLHRLYQKQQKDNALDTECDPPIKRRGEDPRLQDPALEGSTFSRALGAPVKEGEGRQVPE